MFSSCMQVAIFMYMYMYNKINATTSFIESCWPLQTRATEAEDNIAV